MYHIAITYLYLIPIFSFFFSHWNAACRCYTVLLYNTVYRETRIRIRAGSQTLGDTFMPADYIKLSMDPSSGPKPAE